MKTLYLIRHAKSDWGNETLLDIDRPLNERGYTDAYFLSRQLSEKKLKNPYLVSSPAIRALSTALLFSRNLGVQPEFISINKNIYEAHKEKLIKVIETLPDKEDEVILFGHNPGFTEMYNFLTDEYLDNLPTCGIACFELAIDKWKELSSKKSKLKYLLLPKDFRQKP